VTENVREFAGEGERNGTKHEANGIEQQDRLTHVESEAEDELMVKVTAIGFRDALAASRAANDRRGRIEDGQSEHEQRHDHADRNCGLARTDDRKVAKTYPIKSEPASPRMIRAGLKL
jgi:hypothetical protein